VEKRAVPVFPPHIHQRGGRLRLYTFSVWSGAVGAAAPTAPLHTKPCEQPKVARSQARKCSPDNADILQLQTATTHKSERDQERHQERDRIQSEARVECSEAVVERSEARVERSCSDCLFDLSAYYPAWYHNFRRNC